eukprot:6185606-Pleurochrysis_carterae.AAC.3
MQERARARQESARRTGLRAKESDRTDLCTNRDRLQQFAQSKPEQRTRSVSLSGRSVGRRTRHTACSARSR